MRVAYMAHPVGSSTPDGVALNVLRAKRWLRYLQATYPDVAFIAPYIDWIDLCGDDDGDPVKRELALVRDTAVVARCEQIWPVGAPDGLTPGMAREVAVAALHGLERRDDHMNEWWPPDNVGHGQRCACAECFERRVTEARGR